MALLKAELTTHVNSFRTISELTTETAQLDSLRVWPQFDQAQPCLSFFLLLDMNRWTDKQIGKCAL